MKTVLNIIVLLVCVFACHEVIGQHRLPTDTYPINYNVWLNFTDSARRDFYGNLKIEVGVKFETKQIQLNDMGTFIDTIVLSEKNSDVEIPFERSRGTQTTIIDLVNDEDVFKVGKIYLLEVSFSSRYSSLAGSGYTGGPDPTDFIVATNLYCFEIQYLIPCYDEPHFKATFDIAVRHDIGTTAVSNMAKLEVQDETNYLVTTFKTTPKLSANSVAFAITNYAHVVKEFDGKSINAFYGNSYQKSDVTFVLAVNHNVQVELEKYLDVPLAVTEMNLVPIYNLPLHNYGTYGLLIVRHSYYFYNPETSTTLDQGNLIRYVAEFNANQYFSGLVAPEWWPQFWFNQGVSKLLGHKISSQLYPDHEQMDMFFYEMFSWAHNSDAIEPNIESRQDILNHMDGITRAPWKATAMMYMIQNMLTESVFQLAMKQILIERKYQPTNTKQICDIFTRVAVENNVAVIKQDDIFTIIEEWITNRDLPRLTVIRDYKTGVVNVTQTNAENSSSRLTWYLPYNYVTEAEKNNWSTTPDGWLPYDATVLLNMSWYLKPNEWVLFNKEFSAYYRVNYDNANWLLLAKQLRRDHEKIPPITRGQLMHDAYNFCGVSLYGIMLYFFSYLNRETNPVPFQPFLVDLKDKDVLFYGTEIYANYTTFALNQLKPIYDRVKIIDPSVKQTLSVFDEMNQVDVLTYACRFNYQPCLEHAKGLLDIYLETGAIAKGMEILKYGFVLSDDTRFWNVFERINNEGNVDKNLVEMIGLTRNFVHELVEILLTKNGDEMNGYTINLNVADRVTIFEVLLVENLEAIDVLYMVVASEPNLIKEIMGENFHWIISSLMFNAMTLEKYDLMVDHIIPLYKTDERTFEIQRSLARSKLYTVTNLIEQSQTDLGYLIENENDPLEEIEEEEQDEDDEEDEEDVDEEDDDDNVGDTDDGGSATSITISGVLLLLLNILLISIN